MSLPLLHLPPKRGLYDPTQERDACGVGFLAHVKGVASHQIVVDSEDLLRRMDHRGACGCEENTGDGLGIAPQTLFLSFSSFSQGGG